MFVQYQTSLAIGFFLGVVFVMCQQMIILFSIFTESSKAAGQTDSDVAAQQAMAVFSFFLYVIYGLFGVLLSVFRFDIIKEGECQACFSLLSFVTSPAEVLTDDTEEQYEASAEELPPQEEDKY